jgi:DNA-binding GntR family transcriptional regulator
MLKRGDTRSGRSRARASARAGGTLRNASKARSEKRQSYTSQAYEELRRRILENELPANAQYLEQELAEELGVSRTPVREALIRLADERLVEIRPRHGVRVLPISIADMREIYELLTELEALAARRVAEKTLSRSEIGKLKAAVAAMDRALDDNDLPRWARCDDVFHHTLVALSDNSRLAAVVGTFASQVFRVRMRTLTLRPKPVQSNRDHARLVAAIEAGDADRAYQIHRLHRERAGKMLLALLDKLGLDGV